MLHQIKAPQFHTDIGLKKIVMNPLANGNIQGHFKAFECFSSTFQASFYFQGLFKTVLYIQVLFKPVLTLRYLGDFKSQSANYDAEDRHNCDIFLHPCEKIRLFRIINCLK